MNIKISITQYLVTVALIILHLGAFSVAMDIYVAPDGNDAADGTFAAPLATIEGARDKIREIRIDTTSTDGADELTLAAWVYPNTSDGYIGVISTTGDYFALNIVGTGNGSKVDFRADTNGLNSADDVVPTGQWTHLVGIWMSGQIHKLYVNGSLAATNSSPPSGPIDPDVWYMASDRLIDNRFFNGRLKGVHVWTRVLSEPEITAMAADDTLIPATPIFSHQQTEEYNGYGQHKVLNFNPMPVDGITVNFRGGNYFFPGTSGSFTELSSEDSGEPGNPITYRSYLGEEARLIGGVQLDSSWFSLVDASDSVWSRLDDSAKGNIVKVDLSSHGITYYGQLSGNTPKPWLYFNQDRMTIARYPDGEYEYETGTRVNGTTFTYTGDRPSRWLTAPDAHIRGYLGRGYVYTRDPITTIDTSSKQISITNEPYLNSSYSRWLWSAFNLVEEITIPGEWYLDRTTGILYLWPPDDLATGEILFTTQGQEWSQFILVENASNVIFEDLTFELSMRTGVHMVNCNNVTINNCTIRNMQTSVNMNGFNCTLKSSAVYNTEGTGVYANGGDRKQIIKANHVLFNNHFYHNGMWGRQYCPSIYLPGASCGVQILHNEIHENPGSGIYAYGSEHYIGYNDIYRVMNEGEELAAIYCNGDWDGRGLVFKHNIFRNMDSSFGPPFGHGFGAIQFDGIIAGWTIDGNIVYDGEIITTGQRGYNTWVCNARDCTWNNNVVVGTTTAFAAGYLPATQQNLDDRLAKIVAMDYDIPGSPWYLQYPEIWQADYSDPAVALKNINCTISNNVGYDNYKFMDNWSTDAFNWWSGLGSNLDLDKDLWSRDIKFYNEPNCLALREDSPAFGLPGFKRIPWEIIGRFDPTKAIRPVPPIGAEDVVVGLSALYWAPALDAGSHKVYVSTVSQEVIDRLPQAYMGEVTEPNLVDPSLSEEQTYYWAVDEYDSEGVLISSGNLWSFTTGKVQRKATYPIPTDGAEGVATDLNSLYWVPPLSAASHKVYMSKHPQEVIDRLLQASMGEVIEPILVVPTLSQGRTYYWAVDEYNSEDTLMGAGDLWSFSTVGLPRDINGDSYINLIDFAAIASGWMDTQPYLSPIFFEDFETLNDGNLDGQDGWGQFFTSGSMVVGASSAIEGSKGVIGTDNGWNTANKAALSSINFANDDVILYVSALVKYTDAEGRWFYAVNTGANNGQKLEARIASNGSQFAGLYGYSENVSTSWHTDNVYAAVMKIDPVSAAELEMSIGIFDVTSGLPDENTLTYTLVKTYDRTLANYNYTHIAFGAINDTTIGDNLLITTDWSTIQNTVSGGLADDNWQHRQVDFNQDGVIDMNDLIEILSIWLD